MNSYVAIFKENLKCYQKVKNADGTFPTKAKYFGQLYTFHAYFPITKYDENIDRVWVKRMIRVVKVLEEAANNLGYKLEPAQIMIDFEIAAKKAFEETFPRCIVKGCSFHF